MRTQLRNYRKLLASSANGAISTASLLLVVISSLSFRLHTKAFDLVFNQQISPAELNEILEHEHQDR